MYNYNKKSRASAVLSIVTAVALFVQMILMAYLFANMDGEDMGLAIIAVALLAVVGLVVFYAASIPFAIVAMILGILMRVEKSRKKLLRHNVTMLVITCLLMPFIATGMLWSAIVISASAEPLFPTVYTLAVAGLYVACFVVQIVTIVALKKSPPEDAPIEVEWQEYKQ